MTTNKQPTKMPIKKGGRREATLGRREKKRREVEVGNSCACEESAVNKILLKEIVSRPNLLSDSKKGFMPFFSDFLTK